MGMLVMNAIIAISGYKLGDIGPAGGLIIYKKSSPSDGWQYLELAPLGWQYEAGDSLGGGYFVQSFVGGDNKVYALIAAPSDSGQGTWGCSGTNISTSSNMGSGGSNTDLILAGCAQRPIAASIASNETAGGKSDWKLPSLNELKAIYNNKSVLGTIINNYYWSSTQYSSTSSTALLMDGGSEANLGKESYFSGYVRAIRYELISDPTAQWGCEGLNMPNLYPQSFTTLYGKEDTATIVNDCSTSGIAAKVCDNLSLGGFSDWYLPSLGEFYIITTQGGSSLSLNHSEFPSDYTFPIGGNYYWTSSKASASYENGATRTRLNNSGSLNTSSVSRSETTQYIRPMRRF